MSARQESEFQEPIHSQIIEDLLRAKIKAEHVAVAQNQFLARMSHEIRTPLTAMLGYADLLSDFELTIAERGKAMDALRNNGQHLLRLLDDILDLSRGESGQLSVERVYCRPAEVLNEVMRLMKPRAEMKGLSLALEKHPGLPAEIQTDPTRLRQILANLISNALKFTTRGEICLIARPAPEPDSSRFLLFDVIDQGIGMSESQQQRLFQPHAQAEETIQRRLGGTGLGLAISLQLAELLGGSIRCQSVLGQGSTFTVSIATGRILDQPPNREPSTESYLPRDSEAQRKPQEAPVARPATSEHPRGSEDLPPGPLPSIPALVIHSQNVGRFPGETLRAPKILVADDYPDNLRLIVYLLKKCGARVEEATQGLMAVDKVLRAPENDPFDLVLMDIKMPELDGYTATERMRESGYTGKIIALTAETMSGNRDRCLVAGCDDYLTKPIAPEIFWHILSKHLNVETPVSRPKSTFPPGVG